MASGDKRKKGSLGSWFPKASVVKNAEYDSKVVTEISILLFYTYVVPQWSEQRKNSAVEFLEEVGARLNLGGRLRVSREGINATITGAELDCRTFAKELGEFDANVLKTDFKLLIILFKNQYYIKNQTRY